MPARSRSAASAVRPRIHWVALGTLLVALALALMVQGYTHHANGVTHDAAHQVGASGQVPRGVEHGGPVIDAGSTAPRTAGPPDHVVALTFDDGPDPRWTPQILRVLRRHHVHATFFMVGSRAIDHPELVRAVHAGGHQIGIHSLTHADLGTLPRWQQRLELRETQLGISAVTGRRSFLLRPPYSSTDDAVDDAMWQVIRGAAGDGYLTVLSTRDSDDWSNPGVGTIVHNSTPRGGSGEVLLMHDAGGNRAETVAALDRLIPELKDRGYRFETVSRAVGAEEAVTPAPITDRILGKAVLWGVHLSEWVVRAIDWLLVVAGVLHLLRAVMVVGAALRHRRTVRRRPRTEVTEPVSVIVPAYNEEAGIEAAVRSIAASHHDVEVIVVDDGSNDDTLGIIEWSGLERVRLIHQPNAGKPAALNTGLSFASHDLIVMVDGDTVFEPDTVHTLVQGFADPSVGAISGNAKVMNRGGLLGRWQHIEYVLGFNLDRRLFDVARCMPTVPGAIGAFRRSALESVGGVSDDTLAEDTDLTMALCRQGWRVVYEQDAIAWTEAPATVPALWKQRYRWSYGTFQSMWKHRDTLIQGGPAGKLGRRGLLYLLTFQILLPVLAPVVDVFAVYGLVFLDPGRVVLIWLAFLALQLVTGLYAFRLDREPARPLWALPLQQIVYRQLMYLVVIQSLFTALSGVRLRWQRVDRYGSLTTPSGAATRSSLP